MALDMVRLLNRPPLHALLIMVNQTYGLHLNPNHVTVSDVVDKGDGLAEVGLVTFSPQDPNVKVAYTGQNRIQIRRLDAARFFGADFKVDMDAPASTRDIFAHLKEVAKLMVDEHEFRITARDGNRYTLTAAPQSLRWVGSFNLTLTGHRVLDE